MADPASLADIATHPGTIAGGTGFTVAAFFRFLQGREARELATQIALMQQKLDGMAVTLEKHANLGERVALLEASVKAAHERIDGRKRR